MNAFSVRLFRAATVVAIASLTACSTDRYYPVRYGPAPMETPVASQGVPGSQVRALATVLGIAKEDKEAKSPAHVDVRIRLENLGNVDAKLLSQGLSLVSADLVAFGAGQLASPMSDGDVLIPASGSQTVDVMFPGPPHRDIESLDWSGLNLKFVVQFGDTNVPIGMTFSRVTYVPPTEMHFTVGVAYQSYREH